MGSLRSVNNNGLFDTETHDRQNSLNLKYTFIVRRKPNAEGRFSVSTILVICLRTFIST
jgi:hypothetical protein